MRSYFLLMAWATAGCAGVMGAYGPGMTGEQRISGTCASAGPTPGTCTLGSYNSGETTYGIQLGLRAGAVAASVGSIDSGTAVALEAHTDIVVARARWGVGVSGGYGNEHIFGSTKGGELLYSGIPIAAYGQFALTTRIFVHAGAGRVGWGSVSRSLPDETSADASAWRGFGGITFVFKRSAKSDLALRLEARATRSSDVMLGGEDATWSSMGVLAEILYATF